MTRELLTGNREQGRGFGQLYFSLLTALPSVMKYISSGQDARTTRVS
ncbi:hypothetical protein [Dolichospermum flos-aquae]|uniref:Uncharacterized protein n=1 Tax=Dolichospermum flos-aquae LEGE 04289 TaxID=1828708 RepID=A0ACC5PXU0_DOLFA|nr:hypothetical protein [Dolichospermum flos-aquae]MBE9218202.1 hypothetical protein [Dolichospermum flos-aquae LEGE 04289]